MNRSTTISLCTALASLVACSNGPHDAAPQDVQVEAPAVTVSASGAEAPSGPTSDAVAKRNPSGPPALPAGAVLVYAEGRDAFSFTPPDRVTRIDDGAKPCSYQLPQNGNMVSGPEVMSAWTKAEAQRAVAGSAVFLAPTDIGVDAEVRGGSGVIHWTAACGGLCPPGPAEVVSLYRVLHVVAVNMRGVCPK